MLKQQNVMFYFFNKVLLKLNRAIVCWTTCFVETISTTRTICRRNQISVAPTTKHSWMQKMHLPNFRVIFNSAFSTTNVSICLNLEFQYVYFSSLRFVWRKTSQKRTASSNTNRRLKARKWKWRRLHTKFQFHPKWLITPGAK